MIASSRMRSPAGRIILACLSALILSVVIRGAHAQQLRFSWGHREIGPPDYATFRIGPLYSHLLFSQSVGVRYTDGTLDVVDFTEGMQRGAYIDNGIDFPLGTGISLRNYLMISKYMDLDAAIWARYEYYPLKTQDDVFIMSFTDPEFLADFATSFLWEFYPVSYMRIKVYDRPAYLLDYIDQRGIEDPYGGTRFNRFENDAGADADIMVTRDVNAALTFRRRDIRMASDAFADQELTQHRGRAALEYQLTSTFAVGVGADFENVDYVSPGRGDYASMDYEAFASAELSPSSKAAAAVGYGSGKASAPNDEETEIEARGITGRLSFETEAWKDTLFSSSYSRTIRPGFSYGVETVSSLESRLKWDGRSFSATLVSGIDGVAAAGERGIGYRDWRTGLSVTCPMTADSTLEMSSNYLVRDDQPSPWMATAGLPSELVNDYTTWINKISFSDELMEDLSLVVYVEYVVRDSVTQELEYHRLSTGLTLTYVYEY